MAEWFWCSVLLVLHVLELGHGERERVKKVYLVNSINSSCLLGRLGAVDRIREMG